MKVFEKIEALEPSVSNPKSKTKYFLEYIVDGVEVDTIGWYIITNNGIDYDCSLKKIKLLKTLLYIMKLLKNN